MGGVPVPVLEGAGAPAVEHDASGERMRQHLEIGSIHGRSEIRIGGTATPAVAHRHVHPAETLLLKSVDVRGLRITGLACRRQPRGMQWIAHAPVSRLQLAAAAAVVIAALLAIFGALEIR